jgi:uncharacterized protein with PIN domain
MTNLNAQPLEYDWRRTRYLPEHIYDCSHCQTPLETLREGMMLLPGNFAHPGRSALLCQRCTGLFWDAEARNERLAQEAGY